MNTKLLEKIQNPLCDELGLIGSITGSAIGAVGQAHANEQTFEHNKELMGLQFGYGEQAADNAQKRLLEINQHNWENYNSYEAQRASMEKAGLSPALLYGSKGQGGTGVASGAPQGTGTGLPNTPVGNVGLAAIQGAQLGLIKAQMENLDSDTNRKNQLLPTEVRQGNALASLNETAAELNKQKFDFIESNWNDIKNYLESTTGKLYQEFQRLIMENNLYEDMKDKKLNPFIESVNKIISECNLNNIKGLLERAKVKLTEQQTKKVEKEIEEVTEHILLMKAQGKLLEKQEEYVKKYFTKDTVLGSLELVPKVIDAIIPF